MKFPCTISSNSSNSSSTSRWLPSSPLPRRKTTLVCSSGRGRAQEERITALWLVWGTEEWTRTSCPGEGGQEGGRRRKEKSGRSMRGRGGRRVTGLVDWDDPGSGKTVIGGRLSCEGHGGEGFISDTGEEEGAGRGVGRIKKERRKKAARQRKRQIGSDGGLVVIGTGTNIWNQYYMIRCHWCWGWRKLTVGTDVTYICASTCKPRSIAYCSQVQNLKKSQRSWAVKNLATPHHHLYTID